MSFLGSHSRRQYANRCVSSQAGHFRSTSPSSAELSERSTAKLPHSHTHANENPILLCGRFENVADGFTSAPALSQAGIGHFNPLETCVNAGLTVKRSTPFSADCMPSRQRLQTFAVPFLPLQTRCDNALSAFAGAIGTVWEFAATSKPYHRHCVRRTPRWCHYPTVKR